MAGALVDGDLVVLTPVLHREDQRARRNSCSDAQPVHGTSAATGHSGRRHLTEVHR
jgi:hypothetical protein